MQALPRIGSGTRSSSPAGKLVCAHQQSTSKERAATAAQPFGWPHRGQVGASSGACMRYR